MKRSRMIVDVPREIQMAVRLRAVKSRTTTGEVVADAIRRVFPRDVKEAAIVLAAKAGSDLDGGTPTPRSET